MIALSIIAIVISILSLAISFYGNVLRKPRIKYSVRHLSEYTTSGGGLSLAVGRAEVGGLVALQFGITVHVKSDGWEAASNVQARVKAADGSVIVQVHTEEDKLVEKLPDIGRQGSQEVFLTVPLMVPGEEVKLTFWYGIPGAGKKRPPVPSVLLRHAQGLGVCKEQL